MSDGIDILSFDGDGGAETVELKSFKPGDHSLVWVRLDAVKAKSFLKETLLIEPFVRKVLTAEETRPRVLVHKNRLVGIFRGVNLSKKDEPEDMVSIRALIGQNVIVTVQKRSLAITNNITRNLKNGIGPKTSTEFLNTLLDGIVESASDVVSILDDQLDDVEDAIHGNQGGIGRHQLNEMRRRIIVLRRYLLPQRDAINRIPADRLEWLSATDTLHLREISDGSTRLLEDLDSERDRATVLHEELLALVQETINQRMYLLAVVAIIFMPLTFVTGLLGVNLAGIPGAASHHGFWVLCVILIVIFLGQLVYLLRKRWL